MTRDSDDAIVEWPMLGRDRHNTKSVVPSDEPGTCEYELVTKTLTRELITQSNEEANTEGDREKWEYLPNHSPIPLLVNKLKADGEWMKSSSPVVHDGNIFIGTNDGQVHKIGYNGSIRESYELPAEIVSTPTVANGILIVGTLDNSLHGVNIQTGDEVWSIETEGSIFGSPIAVGDTVFVGDIGGQIYALNYEDGEEIWSNKVDNAIVTRPAITGSTLIFGGLGVGDPMGQDHGGPFATSSNYLYAIDQTNGGIAWEQEISGYTIDPLIIDGGVCVGTQSGKIRSLRVEDGSEKWEMSLESRIVGSPATDDGELILGCLDGTVYRIAPNTNQTVWEFETEGSILSEPAIHGLTGVIASEYDGIYVFDTRTGDVIQYFELEDRQRSAPAFTGDGFVLQNSIFLKKIDSRSSDGGRVADDAKRVAEEVKSKDFSADDVLNSELIPQAVQFATGDDEEVRYQGTKALSHLFQNEGENRLEIINYLDGQMFEDNQSLLEAIIQAAENNLREGVRGDTRGRAALTIGYIASKCPERIVTNQVLDKLVELLKNGVRRVRRRRATFALTYLAYYDAPDKETVRAELAQVVDSINELATKEGKRKTQSVGLRALGFIALSYPDAVAPANSLTEAVKNENLRPRNRNRALRALWQLALSRPDIAEQNLDIVIDLLSYRIDEASDTDYIDGDNLEKHARWIRSNAAKTIAVVAAESPTSVDKVAIDKLIEIIETDGYADYRAVLALGELSDEYVDYIIKKDGHGTVQNILKCRNEWEIDNLKDRDATKFGYAGWTLLKIDRNRTIDWKPPQEIVDLLFAVPDSEKTQFHRRRVEGIEILATKNPTLLGHDRIESYLTERKKSSGESTEQLIENILDKIQKVYTEPPEKVSDSKRIAEDSPSKQNKDTAIFENPEEFLKWFRDQKPTKQEMIQEVKKSELEPEDLVKFLKVNRSMAEASQFINDVEKTNEKIRQVGEKHGEFDGESDDVSKKEDDGEDCTVVEEELFKYSQIVSRTNNSESVKKESSVHRHPDIPRIEQQKSSEVVTIVDVDDYKPSHSSDIFEVTVELHGKKRPAWLKVVRAGYDPENQVATNFARTTELWDEIDSHENIVSILAWGTESQPWVATELLSYNLDTLITPGGIDVNKALWISERLADALQHAHNRGVVHFDLKPENVVFEYRSGDNWDQPKITDWQFAKRVADVSGSLRDYDEEYAAPEIRDSDWGPVNHRADLYHLGEILYEMLTGKEWAQHSKPPESIRTEVSPEIGSLVMELLVQRPGNRPETAAEVRNRLRALRDRSESYQPASEVTTEVATVDPPLSQIELLLERRNDSVRACLQQAEDINRKVNSHDLSGEAYDELCALLSVIISELEYHPNPNSSVKREGKIYNMIDDVRNKALSVYSGYIHVDSVHFE